MSVELRNSRLPDGEVSGGVAIILMRGNKADSNFGVQGSGLLGVGSQFCPKAGEDGAARTT